MKAIKISITLFLIFVLNFNIQGQIVHWIGGSTGSYVDVTNWSSNPTMPSMGDTIIFDNGTIINITDVPVSVELSGIHIIQDVSSNPTKVFLSFSMVSTEILLNTLVIDEGCSLNYTEPADIIVSNLANFNGGNLNVNADIILENETQITSSVTLNSNNLINYGTIHLINEGELSLDCILDNNAGTIYINAGTLIINKEFHNEINGFLFGGVYANLIFNENVTYVDPIPSSLTDLNTFECYALIYVSLTTNLKIWHQLKMINGVLDFTNQSLTLSGDFLCESGVLSVSDVSTLIIDGPGSDAQSNLSFNVTDEKNILNSFVLNRPDKIIDINSNLIISNSLSLDAGKLKFWYFNLNLNYLANIVVSDVNPSYIITGPTGSVSATLNAGDSYLFPVGSLNYSAPVNITSQNTGEFFVNVTDMVYSNGYDGVTLPENEIVNLTWDIQTPLTNYDLMLNWDLEAQGSLFSSSDASVFHFNDNNNVWDNISITNTGTAGIISVNTDLSGLFMVSSQINPNFFVEDQNFFIPEHSPNGTIVGQIQAIENTDVILFEMLPHENADAFDISETGLITVSNSSLLVLADTPEFKYQMVANNTSTDQTSNFILSIFLKDSIVNDVFISNYISPNGDGINDTWIVRGRDVGQYRVTVFDKRGNLVFRAEDYMNNWNGTNNGTRLSPGVYYYVVRYNNIEEKGTITLIR